MDPTPGSDKHLLNRRGPQRPITTTEDDFAAARTPEGSVATSLAVLGAVVLSGLRPFTWNCLCHVQQRIGALSASAFRGERFATPRSQRASY